MPEEFENNEPLDTSTEPSTETDTGGAGESEETATPAQPSDWRVGRYGEDFENSLEYWRDTNKYLRGELDKAKRRTHRGIEDEGGEQPAETQQAQQRTGQRGDLPEFKDVGELLEFIDKRHEASLATRERQSSFRQSMQQARQEYQADTENGIPAFTELEEEFLAPLVRQNVAQEAIVIPKGKSVVLELLKHMPNPGQAAWTLAMMLKYKNPQGLRELYAGKGREDLARQINDRAKEAVRVRNGKAGNVSPKLTPEQIRAMPTAEFEKLVARNTGRA